MEDEIRELLTDEQSQTVIMAVAFGQKNFTKVDVTKVREWIGTVWIDCALVDMVLSGELGVNTEGEELKFIKIPEDKRFIPIPVD